MWVVGNTQGLMGRFLVILVGSEGGRGKICTSTLQIQASCDSVYSRNISNHNARGSKWLLVWNAFFTLLMQSIWYA